MPRVVPANHRADDPVHGLVGEPLAVGRARSGQIELHHAFLVELVAPPVFVVEQVGVESGRLSSTGEFCLDHGFGLWLSPHALETHVGHGLWADPVVGDRG